jgi:hypothetical protein
VSRVVWKYELPEPGDHALELPFGAEVLSVACQGDRLCLWALVEPDAPKELRRFRVLGTGWEFERAGRVKFVGTALMQDGALVWHVFEVWR